MYFRVDEPSTHTLHEVIVNPVLRFNLIVLVTKALLTGLGREAPNGCPAF